MLLNINVTIYLTQHYNQLNKIENIILNLVTYLNEQNFLGQSFNTLILTLDVTKTCIN